jgi:hypothetical protein
MDRMSGTKRKRIAWPKRPQFSPKVIALFEELERIAARRNLAECVPSRVYPELALCAQSDCRICKQWYDVMDEIATELKLPPWRWPCLPTNPHVPGSAQAKSWRPDPNGENLALWTQVDEARRNAKAEQQQGGVK